MHAPNPGDIAAWINIWGYWGLFACVFIGNLGIPVPEETVLLAAGFLAAQELLDPKTAYAVAVVAAVVGDNCGYLVGRTGGQRLLDRLAGNFEYAQQRYDRFKLFFFDHGNKAVFLARFVTGLRFFAGPMAGAAGMRFWRFFGWNTLGAVLWCALMISIGYLIGNEWDYAAALMHRAGRWIAVTALLAVVAACLVWWRERRSTAARP